MKKIYVIRYNNGVNLYFGTLKKAHKELLNRKEPVMRHFSEFKRWFYHFDECYNIADTIGDVVSVNVF